jgi:ubiquinone/menaquinone biosynthesis C-methylase UbiE
MVSAPTPAFTGPQFYNDYTGPLWFGPFADELAHRLPHLPPGDVLEVACGTGLVTRGLRERLDPGLRLVATDLSKPMLEYARTKLAHLAGIDWREADALRLPFADGEFGAAVCGLGIMFVADRLAALKEMRRVLKADGLLLLSVWDRIEENPHALANAQVVEAMFPGDAEMRFRTPYEMHDAHRLRELLEGAGFREARLETRRIPFSGADPRRMAIGQFRGTPRSALLEKRGVSVEDAIDKVAAALSQSGGDPYSGYAQALIVQARAG